MKGHRYELGAAVVLMFCIAVGAVLAANSSKTTSVTALLPNLSTSAGLYNDAPDPNVADPYVDGQGANVTINSAGTFTLQPVCSTRTTSGRMMNLVMPASPPSSIGSSAIAQCTNIWLKIPNVAGSQVGQVLGLINTDPTVSSGTDFLYFRVDSNGDGRFTASDNIYNLKWQQGICVSSKTTDMTTKATTYLLTTVPDANLCTVDRSGFAELINRTTGGSEGYFTVPLTVKVLVP